MSFARSLGPALGAAMAVAAACRSASAQTPSATTLFQQATKLFARGEIKSACERFAQSFDLDPAPGTLFNLGVCHEKDLQLWLARGDFQQFVTRAKNAGKPYEPAADHLHAIEAKLPRLALSFAARANVETVQVDGRTLAADQWSSPVPVDPALPDHVIELSGRGLVSELRRVKVDPGSITTVEVPSLIAAQLSPTSDATAVVVPPAAQPSVAAPSTRPRRDLLPGILVGSAGVAAAGVGAVFGALTLSEKSAALDACGNGSSHTCTGSADLAQRLHSRAETESWVSTIGLGVGIAGLGAATYLLIRGSRHDTGAATSAALVLPMVARDGAGLMLSSPF